MRYPGMVAGSILLGTLVVSTTLPAQDAGKAAPVQSNATSSTRIAPVDFNANVAVAGVQTALPTQSDRWQTTQAVAPAASSDRDRAPRFTMKPQTPGTALRVPALAALPYIASHSHPFAPSSDPSRDPASNRTGLVNTIADWAH